MSIYDEKPWLNFYDEGIDPEVVVPDASYTDLFLETAEKYPDKPAIHFMGVTLPYRGLNDLSARFAVYLETCGCGPGDTVGINLPNIPQCLIPDPRNTKHICGEIEKYQPTLMTNVPSLYQILMEEPKFKTLDFSNCKYCISGAAPFAVESIEAFESIVGKGKVLEVYGMTETSPILTANPAKGAKKIGSVGIPVQGTRIKLVDIETGTQEVPAGEEGELIANGPQVMKGYLNKPEETAHALRDFQGEKWLYTGDVAKIDADGFFSIADRVKDMLIVGGYKVFSREVEEKLYQLPDVEFCAVVGVPNADRPGNDIVKLVVQLSAQAADKDPEVLKEEIETFCKKKMAPYKIPKIIEFVDAIPLTAVGKVDKKSLR